MKRVFSGVQPTGDLHLGNYLGAIKQFVKMQEEPDTQCLFCVVDMHAITVKHDPALLAQHSREIAAAYIACGIDPSKSIVFIQSQVPAHAEMAWILNCVARMGWLERMTQFREKTNSVPPDNLREIVNGLKSALAAARKDHGQYGLPNELLKVKLSYPDVEALFDMLSRATSNTEKASVGLFTYPVLMAADILTYKATHVPVGADQKQHLNLARDIAKKFNNDYAADFFPIPEAIHGANARIMSLQDGSAKMSKSAPDPLSRINLSDSDETIRKKIKRATADTLPFPSAQEEIIKPEIENLIGIYMAVTGQTKEQVFEEFGGKGYGVFKPALADALVDTVGPIRNQMARLSKESAASLGLRLRDGADQAYEIAKPVLAEAKRRIGYF